MSLVVLILIIFLVLGGLPGVGFQHGYGWGPSGIGGILLIIMLIMLLTGRL